MKLPHSEEAIEDQQDQVNRLALDLESEQKKLDAMLQENRAAEREEAARKARKMTPTMRAALERLAAGRWVRSVTGIGVKPSRYYWSDSPFEKIPESLLQRLFAAGYFSWATGTITDLGREALKDAAKGGDT